MTLVAIKENAGNSLTLEFPIKEPDGSATDITGATVEWGLYARPKSRFDALGAAVVTFSTANGKITIPSAGLVRIAVSATDVSPARYWHKLSVTMPGGLKFSPAKGPADFEG